MSTYSGSGPISSRKFSNIWRISSIVKWTLTMPAGLLITASSSWTIPSVSWPVVVSVIALNAWLFTSSTVELTSQAEPSMATMWMVRPDPGLSK